MVGGGALLAALASGTGTAALILLLARRPGASAAALGVTGAYAGAGAFLAREGLVRLRQVGPPEPDVPVQDEPVRTTSKTSGPRNDRRSRPSRAPTPDQGGPKLAAQQGSRVAGVKDTGSRRAASASGRPARAGECPELLAASERSSPIPVPSPRYGTP